MSRLRIAIAQLNLVVGDLAGNGERLRGAMVEARRQGCDMFVAPELAITGYPPEDLVLKPSFVRDNREALEQVAAGSEGLVAVIGFVDSDSSGNRFNAAAVCADGHIDAVYHKRLLPNYAVFDEQRYFGPGSGSQALFRVAGVQVGVTICEDIWSAQGPVARLGELGAEVVVNINASPYHSEKIGLRRRVLRERAAQAGCPIVYANLVGGQDELVFDGTSMVTDAQGEVLFQAPSFAEDLAIVDLDTSAVATAPPPGVDAERDIYDAVVLGTRDYVTKNGFSDVALGLSGGVDSSLVAAVAADALGPDRVHGVMMPSRYSSQGSLTDAEALAEALGIDHRQLPIEDAHRAMTEVLAPSFEGHEVSLADENLQARIRGALLMALSNQFGWMVLATSNKTESAVGYTTLYGDSVGGYGPIKDLPKLAVYRLCRYRNQLALQRDEQPPIPESVLTKPPSAELRPDQRDDQSLPPYEVLDPLVEAYVEQDDTASDLVAAGWDADLVRRVARLIDTAEYKRRQAAPGPRVTSKAFGKDRRLPITNVYLG